MEENNEQLPLKERIEFLKAMFSTLEIDEQAKFAEWCHEEVKSGGAKYLGKKIDEVNKKMNSFIAKAYDQTTKGAKFIYENTNEAFKNVKSQNNSMPKSDGSPSFFD